MEEAFNVARDEEQAFIVRTRQADVKVLGTSFNVKAYQEDELIAVSVRTGKVEVDMPESVMRLLPNEQVIVNNTNGEILKERGRPKSNGLAARRPLFQPNTYQ